MIEVETTGPREASYAEFLTKLQDYKNECRYCVFDFPANIPVEGGGEKTTMSVDRLVLMTWYVFVPSDVAARLFTSNGICLFLLLGVPRAPKSSKRCFTRAVTTL